MRIGITGHQKIEKVSWVTQQISSILEKQPSPIVGISSLAIGADQLFAIEIIRHGGILEAIIPFEGYENKFETETGKAEYERLLKLSSKATTLKRDTSDEKGYYEAGKKIVNESDLIIAIWDGKPARGLGGTADIVKYAVKLNKRTIHVNPNELSIKEI